jgi:hypothetical protein
MTFVLANVFGMISGALIMFFVGVILQTILPGGMPARVYLLIPFILGWAIALLVIKPRHSHIASVLDRGLLLGAIEWGLAFPAALVIVLGQSSELMIVSSAHLMGYTLGALIIGGGITLAGVGLFVGLRHIVRRAARPALLSEPPEKAG